MEYSVTKFEIKAANEELLQICRELLADSCGEKGYESFEDTDNGLNAYIQTQFYAPIIADEIIQEFPIEEVEISYTTEEIESEDWNATWEEQGFDPIQVGHRCIIYDAKSADAETLKQDAEIAIAIDARMAFGTGTHETTQMIVAQLLDMDLNGKRVLDCGCGTGILSLVAKRCGSGHVTAYDIDEWSVENTKHNAEINDIELHDILLGDVSVLSHIDGLFDVIVANINRNILLADLTEISYTLDTNGTVILSGFYEEDADSLLHLASTLGLYEVARTVTNGWTMLVLHK